MNIVQWFELYDNVELIVDKRFVFLLSRSASARYSIKAFDRLVGVSGFSSKIRSGNPRLRVGHLKRALDILKIDYSEASNNIRALGRNGSLRLRFPYTLQSQWGELFAHAFFDGYADQHILRYSNYDLAVRKEFVHMSRKLGFGSMNIPESHLRSIDLPGIAPQMLISFFDGCNFYSKKCRIPERFFHSVGTDPWLGWYFLKGAFLDEGTITGGQIWVVRGIVNRNMAEDVAKLCVKLGLKVRIQVTKKDYAYSVGIVGASFGIFYSKLEKITTYKSKKTQSLKTIIRGYRKRLARTDKVRYDCEKILAYLNRNGCAQTSTIKRLCGVSELPALIRLKILMETKNICNIGKGKESRYVLVSTKLPDEIPTINGIRRKFRWK